MPSTTAIQVTAHAVLADRVFDGRCWHESAAVLVRDGRIAAIESWSQVPADWPQTKLPPGVFLTAGFVDLQVNGGGGTLLNDHPTPEGMRAIARAHRRYGTTACLPTLITDTRARMREAVAAARTVAGQDGVLGLHLEGPFISPHRPGVHRADLVTMPAPGDVDLLCDLGTAGRSLVTLAPECVPAGFVRRLVEAGLRVSIGHSEASAGTVLQVVADGATGVTHLYNAMPPMSAREPGIIGTALAEPRLIAGLIIDGLHVDPIAVRAAFAAKGADGIALVTDAMPTIGSQADRFDLMGRNVTLVRSRLTTDQGTLAGAHLDMTSAVRNAVRLAKIPLEDALRAASLTPARFLGIDNEHGALVAGGRADMVALSRDLDVMAVWMGGIMEMDVCSSPPREART
ncbi:N-acetylglucosamine-6-phosphate deacetylase [Xanthobacteraceae bacterium Astr-EGSB]|uniref:N-acetylglucosamine-6-phosphate deacetylase n=1 Tax=Astrobacterium formosum TaxID=3069710 RepID=UPI0027B868B5|nr:N-acetylglucosamine-6-phosphate deacetylase [Xanthobacteraceae bacterium Astr-EGSB]